MCTWQSNLLAEFLSALLDDVEPHDSVRSDFTVSHASGWTLVVSADGRVVWENTRGGQAPRHLLHVHRPDLERMLRDLVDGRISEIDAAPWSVGQGS